MKHIVKKFMREVPSSKIDKNKAIELTLNDPKLLLKSKNVKILFSETTNDTMIQSFLHNYNGNNAIIPIPDLSLVYFDFAYSLNIFRKKAEIAMFDKLKIKNEKLDDIALKEIYKYFGLASGCLINLFASMESFVNHLVSDCKNYEVIIGDRKTEVYTNEQIQRYLSFDEKVKKVLPQLLGRNFYIKNTSQVQRLVNLKNMRDDIIHTKSNINFESQSKLIKSIINFKFDHSFEAVSEFMNFYIPEYIQDCKCGKDY